MVAMTARKAATAEAGLTVTQADTISKGIFV